MEVRILCSGAFGLVSTPRAEGVVVLVKGYQCGLHVSFQCLSFVAHVSSWRTQTPGAWEGAKFT